MTRYVILYSRLVYIAVDPYFLNKPVVKNEIYKPTRFLFTYAKFFPRKIRKLK